jgi:peroxiredoxin
MKNILIVFAGLYLFMTTACHNNESTHEQEEKKDSSYAIIGKVTGLETGMIYLIHRQSGKTDSTLLDHGYFTFSGKADTAEFCQISLNDQAKSFFLENGKISMLIKKDSMHFAVISGTKTQNEFTFFQNQILKPLTDQMAGMDTAYDAARLKKNQRATDSLDKLYSALDLEQKQLVMDFAKSHPASIVSAFEIANTFSYNFRLGQLDSLYQPLDTTVKISYFGRLIQKIMEKTSMTSVGKPAPDFASNDANGKSIPLSSFKGKYVLLDFWASWCGPCRLENPNIVKAYLKFHEKGFDIFGVSLDDTKADWLQAIKKDGLVWTQVSDLKGWQNDAASLYGVRAIPMNFLLDKNGMIVARGLHGAELDIKLTELLH